MTVTGPAFLAGGVGSQTLLGGFVGTGHMNRFTTVDNRADIISQDATGFVDAVYMGGLIGYQVNCTATTTFLTNNGDLILNLNQPMKARMAAGYGTAANVVSTASRTYTDFVNNGESRVIPIAPETFDAAELAAMDIQIAGILIGFYMANATFDRMRNNADATLDLTYVSAYAGVVLFNNNWYSTTTETDFRLRYNNIGNNTIGANTISRAYNDGDIDATTSRPVYHHQIKIAGIALGRIITAFLFRNTGNIDIALNHDASLRANQRSQYGRYCQPAKKHHRSRCHGRNLFRS
ncbi:MAG: hypothetical protein MZU97_22540 [Bacillus subtilis]|nr:hypothetical protein [Bacillus subtilis]